MAKKQKTKPKLEKTVWLRFNRYGKDLRLDGANTTKPRSHVSGYVLKLQVLIPVAVFEAMVDIDVNEFDEVVAEQVD